MNKIENYVTAVKIAEIIFEVGSDPGNKCQRIQFIGGSYPDDEIGMGGLSKQALVHLINRVLDNEKENS